VVGWLSKATFEGGTRLRRAYQGVLFAFFLVLCLVVVGCGETTTPEKMSAIETATQEAQEKEPQYFKIGERVKMGELAITVNGVRESQGTEFETPKEGHKFVIVDATIENLSEESVGISSLLMFKMADADGYNYGPALFTEVRGQLDGELGPGRKMRGEVAFEVPKDAKGLEFIFEPNFLGFGQAIFKL